ncbi:MAG: efflux RND transporter periplasmic adaptor subunit, partial [Pseudomonadota bacterium]
GGGTLLMKMADLSAVQVRALIDETDIGKVRDGMSSRVTVAAYPNQPFAGQVVKIEPQAVVEQNVTMFAVIISIQNPDGLLLPGMNADVDVSIADRSDVLTVPIMALRTERDVASTASILGMDAAELRRGINASRPGAGDKNSDPTDEAPAGETISFNGRTIELPEGVDAATVQKLMAKRRNGSEMTADERRIMRSVFAGQRDGGGRPAGGARPPETDYRFGGEFWVVVQNADGSTAPTHVRTGLTDLDRVEVVAGLSAGQKVLILPSANLIETQERLQNFINQRVGGVPGMGGR